MQVTRRHLERCFGLDDFDARAAQRRMEPRSRGVRPPGAEGREPRAAAALCYLFETGGGLRLPLTVRRDDLPEHRGQVSLPGGRPEAGESLWETARREAREEIALEEDAQPVGRLAPVYIPITHTRLHVHVAVGVAPERLRPEEREVARIVVVGLDDLLDARRRRVAPRTIAGREIDVPYFDVGGLFLWGATAMALSELVERLRRVVGEGA